MPIDRRVFCAASAAFIAAPARAQFRVEISGVGATQLPIAIARFRDEDRTGQSLSAIIRADLERSGAFRGIDDSAQRSTRPASRPGANGARAPPTRWSAGSVTRLADGRFDVRFKLWDVVKGSDLGGQSNAVDAADLRLARAPHRRLHLREADRREGRVLDPHRLRHAGRPRATRCGSPTPTARTTRSR